MASSLFKLDLPPMSSGTAMGVTGDIEADGDVLRCADSGRAYEGGSGAGGKLRFLKRASGKKTPYDRPPSGRHAPYRGVNLAPVSSSSTITSRIVGSASRLISSSASYLFTSLFNGRKTHAITEGRGKVAEAIVGTSEEQSPRKNMASTTANRDDEETLEQDDTRALVVKHRESARVEIEVSQVEEIIKRQTWSREQVERLTKVLQDHVADTSTIPITTTRINHLLEESRAAPILESQRWREELKKARNDPVPVEIARAYMGERTSLVPGLTSPFRGSANQHDRFTDLQPPPVLGLWERTSPITKPWVSSPSSQAVARSSVLKEEWMSLGPIRRAQQKPFGTMGISSSSSYVRREDAEALAPPPATFMSTPIQASQTAQMILDTLEKLTPPPNEKVGEGGLISGRRSSELIPSASPFGTRKTVPMAELSHISKNIEQNLPICMQSPTIGDDREPKGHILSLLSGCMAGKERLKLERQVNSRCKPVETVKPPPLSTLSGSFQRHGSGLVGSSTVTFPAAKHPSPSELLTPKLTLPSERPSSEVRTSAECNFTVSLVATSAEIVQASSSLSGFPSLVSELNANSRFRNYNENGTYKGAEMGKESGHNSNGDPMVRHPEQSFKAGHLFSVKPANSDSNTIGTKSVASFDSQIVKEPTSQFSFGKAASSVSFPSMSFSVMSSTIAVGTTVSQSAINSFGPPLFSGFSASSPASSGSQGSLYSSSAKAGKDPSLVSAAPTFSFTSPSKEAKLPVIPLGSDISLPPVPIFSFGSSNMVSSLALPSLPSASSNNSATLPVFAFGSSTATTLPTPIFSFGSTTSSSLPASALSVGATVPAGAASLFGASAAPSIFSFGSTAPTASVISSFSLPSTASAATSGLTDVQVKEVASTSLQIGGEYAGAAEKAGRKFIRAKKRK